MVKVDWNIKQTLSKKCALWKTTKLLWFKQVNKIFVIRRSTQKAAAKITKEVLNPTGFKRRSDNLQR